MSKTICIFGSYLEQTGESKAKIVRLGRQLAEAGWTVMSGGFGGVMEHICEGARQAGGKTVGVTFYKYGKTEGKKPNPFIDDEIVTETLYERIDVMLKKADAFIVCDGGTGTLFEFATALEQMHKRLLPKKPIVAVGKYWRGLMDVIRPCAAGCDALVTFVDDVDQVVGILEQCKGKG